MPSPTMCVPGWLEATSSGPRSLQWELCPDVDLVLRSEGADPVVIRQRRPEAVAIAEQAIAKGAELLHPAVLARAFAVTEFRHERLLLEGGGYLGGPLIADQLHRAHYVVAAVCTIGSSLEIAASTQLFEDPAMGIALDAFGSAAVHMLASALCERLGEQAKTHGLGTSTPFSPGLVGWPLASGQAQLFGLVDAKSIGVRLTDGYMMLPRKSTSLVVGIGEDLEHSGDACDYCKMAATCRYRLRRLSEYA